MSALDELLSAAQRKDSVWKMQALEDLALRAGVTVYADLADAEKDLYHVNGLQHPGRGSVVVRGTEHIEIAEE